VFVKLSRLALTGSALAVILAGLPGCKDISAGLPDAAAPLPAKPAEQTDRNASLEAVIAGTHRERTQPVIEPGPAPPPAEAGAIASTAAAPPLAGQIANVTIEQMPIPAFINTVLGETLHLTFEIDPKVSAKTDLVTLRTGGPKSAQELLAITREVLRTYGIQLTYDRDVLRVRLSETLSTEMPQIIIGRTSPDIAASLRPIFQVIGLDQVNNQDMATWLSSAFGTKIKFIASPANNSIILLGLPEDVHAAAEGIRLLDQPRLAGRQSLKVVPVFWTAAALSEKLSEILRVEGYNVSSTAVPPAAVTLLPLAATGTVLVFASDQKILDHVAKWARDLDQPAQVDPRQSVFYYPVRNTTADSLLKVLTQVLGDTAAAPPANQTASDLQQPGLLSHGPTPGATAPGHAGSGSARFVTDPARNALIFLGSAESYAQVLPLIQNLDQPPREVLIELTIAQVTLNDDQQLGIEWSKVGAALAGTNVTVSGGAPAQPAGIGTAGLFLQVLSGRNSVAATLSALQTTSKTKVVTTPRLLARSGATAKFQVGTDIPIVTAQVTAGPGTFTPEGLQQSITYRSTGTIISVKPVIYAGDQIDLDIQQEQSGIGTGPGIAGSPPISNQNVTTQLSLADGATVLLGGFISDSKGDDDTGVPYLKDIPGVGALFRSNEVTLDRTETLIFITPYIINSGADSERIIDSVRDNMKSWPEVHQSVIH
jgi:general secretion pathway protein D